MSATDFKFEASPATVADRLIAMSGATRTEMFERVAVFLDAFADCIIGSWGPHYNPDDRLRLFVQEMDRVGELAKLGPHTAILLDLLATKAKLDNGLNPKGDGRK